jgi:tetratricopeptide (TPR) repeat protein
MQPLFERQLELPPPVWLRRYEPDLDNLRAAITWSLRHAPARAIELVGDSLKLWQELALHPEARRYCEAALAHVTAETPPRAAGRLWYAEAMLAANMWPGRSRDAARRAIALLRGTGDEVVFAYALGRLSNWTRGAVSEEQLAALHELERLERPEWRGQLRWLVPYMQAVTHRASRRFAESRRSFARTLEITREIGDVTSELRHLVNVAEVTLMDGDIAEAIRIATDARNRLGQSYDRLFYLFATTSLVYALCIGGDAEAAREPIEAAVPLLLRYDNAFRFAHMGALYAALQGDLPAAARMLGYAARVIEARDELDLDSNAVTAGERVRTLLAGVPAEQLETWRREGAELTDAAAFRGILHAGKRPA